MWVYAITIFASAFLLFQVQPVIAKAILPWFGGAAAVWTTCMLFFQVALLAGYVYAHRLQRLAPARQAAVHLSLLALSLLALPIVPAAGWKPTGAEDPVLRIVGLLAATIGLPYFLLSTTGPLLQAWYAQAHKVRLPYRLFALSNFASLLALIAYPVAIEPFVSTRRQMLGWSIAYAGFAILCGFAAWRSSRAPAWKFDDDDDDDTAAERPDAFQKTIWLALAACASAFLLAVTNQVSQNVAPVPFLWVLPLALYLLTFVICFDREGWYHRGLFQRLLPLALGAIWYTLSLKEPITSLFVVAPLFGGGLFVACMFCHGELARLKPHGRYLTSYYLMIALGGALGGLFVGLVAPLAFNSFLELQVAMVVCALLAIHLLYGYANRKALAILSVAALVFGVVGLKLGEASNGVQLSVRNFYGVLRVFDSGEAEASHRTLMHGQIKHGLQFLSSDRRRQPTTYYGPESGAGWAIRNTRNSSQRVGVIGLGTGTLAAYAKPGDYYRFYEINPLVLELAQTNFSYLKDTPAKVEVALGDARLSLEREAPQNFDVLVVDAFSGDSIPVHLLTREAFELYFRHIRPGGVLAMHVSNLYLNLPPVVQKAANYLKKRSILFHTQSEPDNLVSTASWMLLTDNQRLFDPISRRTPDSPPLEDPQLRMWTDDYSNLWQILR